MKPCSFLIFFLLGYFQASTQKLTDHPIPRIETRIDSLQKLLKNSNPDSNKVLLQYELAAAYNFSIRNKEAIEISNSALQLSKQIRYKRGECLASFILGIYETRKANYAVATEYVRQILRLAKDNNYYREIGHGYFLQAFISNSLKKYDEAKELCIRAVEIAQNTGDKINLARSTSLLATICRLKNNYLEAIANFSTASGIYEEVGYPVPAASVYSRIAEMFYHLGGNSYEVIEYNTKALRLWEMTPHKNLIAMQHIDIADAYMNLNEDSLFLAHLNEALLISRQINDTIVIATAMNKTGEFYLKKGKYADALFAFTRALALYQQQLDEEDMPKSYFNLGDLNRHWGDLAFKNGDKETGNKKFAESLRNYLVALEGYKKLNARASESSVSISIGYIQTRLGNLDAADKFLNTGLSSALHYGEKTTIAQAYFLLSGLDSMKGDYRKAFEHIKLHQLYRDSLINIDVLKKIEAAKLREEINDKDQRITLLNTESELKTVLAQKQKQQKTLAYGIIAIIVLAGSYGFYRYRQRKKTELEKEKLNDRLSISQGLHDNIGSTLSSISVYTHVAQKLSEKDRKEDLDEMLEKIKTISSEMISEMNDIVWTIHPKNDNMEKIILRMESYAKPMLKTRNINFKLVYDPAILTADLEMEKRKNFYLLFKEAVNNAFKYSGCSEVVTQISYPKGQMEIVIKDNGVGFDVQQETAGVKLTLSGNGLRNMKMRAEEMKGDLQINSLVGEGTEIRLSIPIP